MGPQTEQAEFISEENPIWKPIAIMSTEFPADNEGYADVTIFFGTKDIDREGESAWDPDFIGELIWDEKLNVATEASQVFLKNMCSDMIVQDFTVNDEENYKCWIFNFEKYVTRTIADSNPEATAKIKESNPFYQDVPGLEQEFPVKEEAKFYEYLALWLATQEGKQFET